MHEKNSFPTSVKKRERRGEREEIDREIFFPVSKYFIRRIVLKKKKTIKFTAFYQYRIKSPIREHSLWRSINKTTRPPLRFSPSASKIFRLIELPSPFAYNFFHLRFLVVVVVLVVVVLVDNNSRNDNNSDFEWNSFVIKIWLRQVFSSGCHDSLRPIITFKIWPFLVNGSQKQGKGLTLSGS